MKNGYDVVKEAARRAGMSTRQMLIKAGKSDTYLANAKARGSVPTTTTAAALLAVCDYTLCAVPSDTVPSDALVIDAPAPDQDAQARALKRKRDKLAAELKRLDDALA